MHPPPHLAIAQFGKVEAPTSVNAVFLNFQTGLPLLLDLGLKIAFVLLLFLLMVGGLRYLMSFGNEESSEGAKRLLTAAVVGFVLLMGTWAIMLFVFSLFGYKF